jgi:hypothetical protein
MGCLKEMNLLSIDLGFGEDIKSFNECLVVDDDCLAPMNVICVCWGFKIIFCLFEINIIIIYIYNNNNVYLYILLLFMMHMNLVHLNFDIFYYYYYSLVLH